MSRRLVLVAAGALAVAAASPVGLAGPCPKPNAIPEITVRGTVYEIGVQTGAAFAAYIKAALATSPDVASARAYIATGPGKQAFASLCAVAEAFSAEYYSEAQGLADGSGVPMSDIMIINTLDELTTWAAPHRVKSCSDVLCAGSDGSRVVGHNEDGDPQLLGLGYITHAQVLDATGANTLNYTTYNYAGQIATGAWGFNSNGLWMSLNGIPATTTNASGVARCFVHRYLLAAASLNDAIMRATSVHVGRGFSCNLAQVGDSSGRIVNIELGGNQQTSIETVAAAGTPDYDHFNMYKRLSLPQQTDPSTVHRQATANTLPPPTGVASVLNVIGDTSDSAYPIYRNGAAPDDAVTLISGVIHILPAVNGTQEASIGVYMNNPNLCAPLIQWRLVQPVS